MCNDTVAPVSLLKTHKKYDRYVKKKKKTISGQTKFEKKTNNIKKGI